MKSIQYLLLPLLIGCLLSCSDFLEVDPKGKNILNTLEDLETLLNDNHAQNWADFSSNLFLITNEAYYGSQNPPAYYAGLNDGSLLYAYMAYDETVDRAGVSETDRFYQDSYSKIARYNVFLSKVDDMSGDDRLKNPLKAEARTMRAYVHWLLVNVYARAYEKDIAKTSGGIPYVTDVNFDQKNTKLTLEQVYTALLNDLSEENLKQLPVEAVNFQRVSRAFGFAVRARVHLSMHNHAAALSDADSALYYNRTIEDRKPFIGGTPVRSREASDNYIYMPGDESRPVWSIVSAEWMALYEAGDIMRYHTDLYESALNISKIPKSYTWRNGTQYKFNSLGLKSEDMLLVRAECLARLDKTEDAMQVINSLRKNRIHPDDYTDLTATDTRSAMAHIIKVSKIEYLLTYSNFFNIKRWNTEEAYRETINKTFLSTDTEGNVTSRTYTLRPDSPLWIMPFPINATNNNPSLTQNY